MTFSRWLSLSIFTAAIVGAWQLAQPESKSAPQCIVAPTGNPFTNAACTGDVSKPRLTIAPPEPRKISNEYFSQ